MTLDYNRMMSMPAIETHASYAERDVILYALGVGVGIDSATSSETLRYTYEAGLEVLPTMAVTIGYPGFWLGDPKYNLDWMQILHGEQSLEVHVPFPVKGDVVSRLKIDEIYDKGSAKGAVLYATREIFDAGTGNKYATLKTTSFLRGDGGFGGKSDGSPTPHRVPQDRPPDVIITASTRADQALLYRLSGDYNPLHVDNAVARTAGYARPILHGLCTFGILGRVLLSVLCKNNGLMFKALAVRFSGPVFPGETIQVDIWHERTGTASVRARVVERNAIVADNGLFQFDVPMAQG